MQHVLFSFSEKTDNETHFIHEWENWNGTVPVIGDIVVVKVNKYYRRGEPFQETYLVVGRTILSETITVCYVE
jgi:hypothetical protein